MSRFVITTILAIVVSTFTGLLVPTPLSSWLVFAVAVAYLVMLGFGVASIRFNFFQPAFCHGSNDRQNIAITFDDGPDNETTEMVLDILAEYDVPATFFCVGEKVRACPLIVRRMVENGHSLGNHSMHHHWYTNFLFGKRLESEISAAQDSIVDAVGEAPKYFRPPMGLTNPHYKKILRSQGLELIGWNVRSLDLNTTDPEKVIRRVVNRVDNGSIILLHDSGHEKDFLRVVLTRIIEQLSERKFKFVSLDRLKG